MMTNVDLPKVLSFESEDHVLDFMEAAVEIIPKIKYQRIGGEGYNCILYTRKDKNFRTILKAVDAPVTIVETPVTSAINEVMTTTASAVTTVWAGPPNTPGTLSPGYFTMPMDTPPNDK